MIPGTTTKVSESTLASAATISPKTDVVYLTGTTGINNIVPSFGGGWSGLLMLVSVDGGIVIGTSGNVAKGVTTVQNQVLALVYSKSRNKWFPAGL